MACTTGKLQRAQVVKPSTWRSDDRWKLDPLPYALAFQLSLFLGLVQFQPASAAGSVPEHLIGLTQALLDQIEEGDFPSTRASEQVNNILARSRISNWRGTEPNTADFSAETASLFGLDITRPDHRKMVSDLLSATDESEQRLAMSGILESGGKPAVVEGDDTINGDDLSQSLRAYRTLISDKLQTLKRSATIETGENGESLTLEWDPEAASFSARFKAGAGQDEVFIHGGVTARQDGERLQYQVVRDPSPITVVDDKKREQMYPTAFGVWVDNEGARWTISGAGNAAHDDATTRAAAERQNKLIALEAKLDQLEKGKIYIWVNSETDEEITQKKFKRLKEPFVYDLDRSRDFNKNKIDDLRNKIEFLEQAEKKLPVDKFDPTHSKTSTSNRKNRPVFVNVNENDGYGYIYNTAKYDGERITAQRTLVNRKDIKGLPDRIITELIGSWSPPEWIELNARYHPRSDSLSFSGKRWRLNVTYDPNGDGVDNIHTPFSTTLRLEREAATGDELPKPDTGSEIRTASGAGGEDLP
jgi:hypothetical protein